MRYTIAFAAILLVLLAPVESMAFQALRPEPMDMLSEHWARQDTERMAVRERVVAAEEDFGTLERLLANSSEEKRRALAEFKAALQDASAERRAAVDAAKARFRASVMEKLQSVRRISGGRVGSFPSADIRALSAQYREEIHTATALFRTKVSDAQTAFKAVLGE